MIAIYGRQSLDKKDSISIETQIEYGKFEAKNEPFVVYTDKGYSGKNTKRPAFEKMMKDIEEGKISKVAVYRLDRISRSIIDFGNFINTLESHNVSFVSATEKFDTSTPVGRAMLYIIIVFAQLERETLAERVKDNYYSRVKGGSVGGGPAPLGFDLVHKTVNGKRTNVYAPNKDIDTVALIFKEYAKPLTSLADVQRVLKSKNILTATGHPWDNAKLSTILKSPAYVKADISIYNYYKSRGSIIVSDMDSFNGENGCVLVGKRQANERKYADVSEHVLAVMPHKGIIDSDTFLFIQDKLSRNKQIKNTNKGKYSWLTGFIKCKHCGYALTIRNTPLKEGIVSYFVCSGRYVTKSCNIPNSHRALDVEAAVEEKLLEHIKEVKPFSPAAPQTFGADAVLKKISEIDARINALVMNLEDPSFSSASLPYINQRISDLDKEKQISLERYSEELEKQRSIITLPEYDYDHLSFEDKRDLARLLIDKIIISNDSLEISWK